MLDSERFCFMLQETRCIPFVFPLKHRIVSPWIKLFRMNLTKTCQPILNCIPFISPTFQTKIPEEKLKNTPKKSRHVEILVLFFLLKKKSPCWVNWKSSPKPSGWGWTEAQNLDGLKFGEADTMSHIR